MTAPLPIDDPTILVFLPDADHLTDLHPGWPGAVGVALCLRATGTAEAVLLDARAADPLPEVARRTGASVDDFLVVPRTGGYGTRPFGFADEQALLAALADAPGLLEAARAWTPPAPSEPSAHREPLRGVGRIGGPRFG